LTKNDDTDLHFFVLAWVFDPYLLCDWVLRNLDSWFLPLSTGVHFLILIWCVVWIDLIPSIVVLAWIFCFPEIITCFQFFLARKGQIKLNVQNTRSIVIGNSTGGILIMKTHVWASSLDLGVTPVCCYVLLESLSMLGGWSWTSGSRNYWITKRGGE